MLDRLLNLLLVKRDELGTLLLLGANLFLATLALIVSQIVAETLFLSAYGGDVLIYVYMVNGVGAVAAGTAYGRLQGKVRAGLFEMIMVMLFAMLFGMLWIGIDGAPQWMLIALMVFAEIFGTLIILQAWNTNGALLSTRSAKRLMPLISGFGTFAGILSGVLVGSLAGPLGTVNLIGLVVLALLLMTVLAYPLAKRLCVSMERIAPQPKAASGSGNRPRFGSGALVVLGNRHIQILLAMTAVATLTSMLVDYQFKVFSQAHFTLDGALDKDRLSTFYGQLQIVVSVLALVLQFGMASRVLERFGIAMTLALLPAVILTGALGIVLGIGSYFAAATLSRSGDKVLKFSLYGSTNQMLFMALPEYLQKTARTLSNAIVRPATFILAGVLLICVTEGAGMNDAAVGWLTGAMALVWIVLSVTAERRYMMSLLNLLARNRIQFHTDQIEITDAEAIGQVRAQFAADDPQRIANSLAIALRIKGVDLVPEVVRLTGHDAPRVRAAAATFIGERGGPDQVTLLRRMVSGDADPGVRAKAAHALFKLDTPDSLEHVRPYLEDRDLPVRVVALAFFLASEHEEERRLGNATLDRLAASTNPEERLAALDAVMSQKAQTCTTTVLRALEDPAPEVCCRAALAAAAVNCPGVWGELLKRLREDRLHPMELVALGQADAGIVPQLRELLLDTDLPIRVRRQGAQILGRIGGEAALEALLERLQRPLLTVPLDAARAASRIVRGLDAPLPRKRVEGALKLLYHDAYQITAVLADFEESPLQDHVALAALVLRRRLRRVLETLFTVLGLTYPADVIDLAVSCLDSDDRKQLDTAIEVINQALEREDRALVVPLIEAESPAASLNAVGKQVQVTRRSAEERIERWLRHADPWRSTAALWTTADAQLQRLREKVRVHLTSEHAVVRETAALAAWNIEEATERRRLLEPLRNDPVASIRQLVDELLNQPTGTDAPRPA
jgi:AAA family ATP:ADP antiporter